MFGAMRRIYQYHNSLVRLCNSLSTQTRNSDVLYESKFSLDEETRILKILNESPLEDLYKFNATKARLIRIDHWRTKKGQFKLLSDVLEIEGFGIKVFENLCLSILNNVGNDVKPPTQNGNIPKSRKPVVTPLINCDTADGIRNAVSLHLTPGGLSWCKLQRQGNSIVSWNLYDFGNLPKKLNTCDLVHLAINILNKIPLADAYVFETPVQLSPQAKQKMMATASHLQQLELSAMLTALLNTNPKHNPSFCFDTDSKLSILDVPTYNRVYFLRQFLSARLFGTLVGTEMVSAITTIESLLELAVPEKPLPCSKVGCSSELQQYYSSQTSVNKHLLGQALLIIISFMDLCIYNSPISVIAISSRQRR